jgi:hypothetical protein
VKEHNADESHQKKVSAHLLGQIYFDIHVNEGDESALNSTDKEAFKEMSVRCFQTEIVFDLISLLKCTPCHCIIVLH